MHNSLPLPRTSDDPDDAQDRMPDDPPTDDVPPEKMPDGESGEGKGEEEVDDDRKEYRAGNCNDCNRQFCLDYNLPICKGAGMEDVFTTCFRESAHCCEIGKVGNMRIEMDGEGGDEFGEQMADMSAQSETRERMRRWSSFSSLLRRGC